MDTKDEYYRDMLDGLYRYLEHPFVKDILHTVRKCEVPDLGNALNKNQIEGKKWLVEELYNAFGGDLGTIYVLGGWYGVLGAMLLHDQRFQQTRNVVSFDLNPECKTVAEHLNRFHLETNRFQAVTKDMLEVTYTNDLPTAGTKGMLAYPGLVINTSCEHLSNFSDWYHTIPKGMRLVLQSNDYYSLEEHVNCVPNLEAFIEQTPMSNLMFSGGLQLKRYQRFMLIGAK